VSRTSYELRAAVSASHVERTSVEYEPGVHSVPKEPPFRSLAEPAVTADRKPDQLPTTVSGAPVAALAPGPLPRTVQDGEHDHDIAEEGEGEGEDRSGEADEGDEAEGMEVDEGR
jgi:hypothetical protein